MRRLPVLAILSCLIPLLTTAVKPAHADVAGDEMLQNPGLEAPYTTLTPGNGKAVITGDVASGWEDNSSWADVTIEYSQAHDGVHGGQSAQRIFVKDVRGGAAQFAQQVPVIANHIYVASVWLKGAKGVQAAVALRQGPAPYDTYDDVPIMLDGNWDNVIVQATIPIKTDVYLMIYPPTGSPMLVDDASVKDVTSTVSDAPAKIGNLLPDGSFEAGFGGGWSVRVDMSDSLPTTQHEYEDPRPVLDTTDAADQKQSVKITLPCAGGATFTSPFVAYNYGRPHTIVAWMKSSAYGTSVYVKLDGAAQTKRVELSPAWQKLTFTMTPRYGDATRLTLGAWTLGPGTIWIDGVGLYEGQPPATATPAAELTLGVDRPGSIFFDGESAQIHIKTANAPEGGVIKSKLLDLYGKTVSLPTVPASSTLLTIAPDNVHPRGMFKVTSQLFSASGDALTQPIQQVFARLPKPRDIDPENSYFGSHIPLADEYFKICRATGTRWARIHDASWATIWPAIEPAKGQFTYTDTGVDAANKAGVRILGMLDGGPTWASVKPRTMHGYFANYNVVDAPGALDEWKVYVHNVVAHYKGKIDDWEVWNEPWGRDFTPGSASTYGSLLKLAYPIAKAANPGATIVGVDTERDFAPFTDTAMQIAGGTSSYDQFSYHDYYTSMYGGPNSPAAKDEAAYDAFETKYGHITPRWVTESAPWDGLQSFYWPIGKEQNTRTQYTQTIRFDVSLLGHGVKRVFYYSLHSDPPYGENCLFALEHDRTIRPLIAARAVLASLVDGAPCSRRQEPVTGVDSYVFKRSDGSSVNVLWSYDGNDHEMRVPEGAKALNAIGNVVHGAPVEVGAEPVYFVR